MKTVVLFLLTSLTYVQPSHEANSTMRCLIEPKSIKVALKNSTAVFSGEVLEIRSGVTFLQARFRVERSWKGVEAEQVSVLNENTAESPHYRVGEKYLVFAGFRDGKLFTGNCSRTKRMEYAEEDLKQLGEGKSHSKAGSI
jgi:hypothetical protein